MAAPLKKMRLTFLWADESTMIEDFRRKISQKQIDWANSFYNKYGFELDISPAPNIGKVPLAQNFCLRKTDGYRPDTEYNYDGLKEDQDNETAPFSGKINSINTDIAKLEAEGKQLDDEIAELQAQLNALPLDAFDQRMPLYDKISKKYDKRFPIYDKVHALNADIATQQAQIDKIVARYDQKRDELNYELQWRKQLGDKFKNSNVIDEKRLNIIFARFTNRSLLQMRDITGHTLGETFLDSSIVASNGEFLWPQPFIMIDLLGNEPMTLAHELVHTTGRFHPPAQKVIKNLTEYLKYKPLKPRGGGLLNYAITQIENEVRYEELFKAKPGGWFDGPTNYILNYKAKGLQPDEVFLEDIDVKRFENVFFVV